MSGLYRERIPVRQTEAVKCQVDFNNFSESSEEELEPEIATIPEPVPKQYDRSVRSMSSQTEEAKRTNVPLPDWQARQYEGWGAIGSDDVFEKKGEPTIKDRLREANNEVRRFFDGLFS